MPLEASLASIPMEGREIDDVQTDVKRVCLAAGTILAVTKSERTEDKSRKKMLTMTCRHGVRNRQAEYQAAQENGEKYSSSNVVMRFTGTDTAFDCVS